MISNVELNVTNRNVGKSSCRKLRRAENVPGVVYGAGKKNTSIIAEEKIVKKYASHEFENAIFTLKSDDGQIKGTKVLFKDVVRHPVSRRPLHFDLLAIDMNKEIRVHVELRCEGKPIGLSEGGVLEQLVRQLEVSCLPTKIPEYIRVDVSPLHVGQAVHLSEITLPEGVKAVSQDDLAIATMTVVAEEVAAPVAAAATDAAAAPGAAAPAAGAAAPAAAAPAADAKKAEKK